MGEPTQTSRPLEELRSIVDGAARAHQAKASEHDEPPPRRRAEEGARGGARSEHAATAPSPPAARAAELAPRADAFYVYRDAQGTEHLVNSLDAVPEAFRKRAQVYAMESRDAGNRTFGEGLSSLAERVGSVAPAVYRPGAPFGLHVPSLLLGVAGAAVLFLVATAMRKKTSPLVRVIVVAVALSIAGVAYLGWVRREAGLSGDVIARPGDAVDDARAAARMLEERNARQLEAIERLEGDAPPGSR